MGKRLGASRRMPNLSENSDRLENKEYFMESTNNKTESANDPWSVENVNKNRELYKQNPLRFIEHTNKVRKYC